MKKITKTYQCDICGVESMEEMENVSYPVIFHTEQNEGRKTDPYISHNVLDLCKKCMGKVLMVDGYGAQGHNRYKIRK